MNPDFNSRNHYLNYSSFTTSNRGNNPFNQQRTRINANNQYPYFEHSEIYSNQNFSRSDSYYCGYNSELMHRRQEMIDYNIRRRQLREKLIREENEIRQKYFLLRKREMHFDKFDFDNYNNCKYPELNIYNTKSLREVNHNHKLKMEKSKNADYEFKNNNSNTNQLQIIQINISSSRDLETESKQIEIKKNGNLNLQLTNRNNFTLEKNESQEEELSQVESFTEECINSISSESEKEKLLKNMSLIFINWNYLTNKTKEKKQLLTDQILTILMMKIDNENNITQRIGLKINYGIMNLGEDQNKINLLNKIQLLTFFFNKLVRSETIANSFVGFESFNKEIFPVSLNVAFLNRYITI